MFLADGDVGLEGKFIDSMVGFTDGSMSVLQAEAEDLGSLLKERDGGYSAWFLTSRGTPVKLYVPTYLVNGALRAKSTRRRYRVTGTLEASVSRGTGVTEHHVNVLGIFDM